MRQFRPSPPTVAALCTALVLLLLFLVLLLSGGLLGTKEILLADPQSGTMQPAAPNGQPQVLEAEVTTENVKQVIASLSRPAQYTMQVKNTLYYTGGEGQRLCRMLCFGQNQYRIDQLDAGGEVVQTILRNRENAYAWRGGQTNVTRGKWGSFSGDAAAMLPTYEQVLGDEVQPLSAAYRYIEGEPCIEVSFAQQQLSCIYTISAITGLLKSAEFRQDEQLIRAVSVEVDAEPPDAMQYFRLPNGKAPE